jgi:hypothetical protein
MQPLRKLVSQARTVASPTILSGCLFSARPLVESDFFLVNRSIFENWLWKKKPFSYGQAWIDLIGLANYRDGTILVRNMKIAIKRGQVGWSVVRISARWGWSRTAVKNFLKLLKSEQQIEQQNNNITSIITILNYDKYQIESSNQSSKRAAREQQEDTNNKRRKNVKEYNPYNPLKNLGVLPGTYIGKSDYDPSPEEARAILEQIEKERFRK